MYKRTKTAGILFLAVCGLTAYIVLGILGAGLLLRFFSGMSGDADNFTGGAVLIFIAPTAVWILFILGSIGILKRGKEYVDAENYRKKLSGTIIFAAVFGVAVLGSLILAVFIIMIFADVPVAPSEEFLSFINASFLIRYLLQVILSLTGEILLILDIVKNKRDLAKIK
jgi:Na+/proline symporter